ncbi:hypothetical protein EDD22DRAFT_98784 [Suillus occidentalis]|nr:hypothetical protein EDD22DRAFT_98784 [Suillus occidentalis]
MGLFRCALALSCLSWICSLVSNSVSLPRLRTVRLMICGGWGLAAWYSQMVKFNIKMLQFSLRACSTSMSSNVDLEFLGQAIYLSVMEKKGVMVDGLDEQKRRLKIHAVCNIACTYIGTVCFME